MGKREFEFRAICGCADLVHLTSVSAQQPAAIFFALLFFLLPVPAFLPGSVDRVSTRPAMALARVRVAARLALRVSQVCTN